MAIKNGNGKPKSVFMNDNGDVITSKADIVRTYREQAKSDLQNELDNLNDDQIYAILRAVVGDESTGTVREDRLAALVEANDEGRDELEDTSPMDQSAMTPQMLMAERIGEEIGAITEPFLKLAADTKETDTGTPMALALELMRKMAKDWGSEFADNGFPIRCPGVLQFPVPGSSYNDADGTWGDNKLLDIDQVKNELTTGKRVTRFYRTMALAYSGGEGPQLISDINDLAAQAKTPDAVKNPKLKAYAANKEGRKSINAKLTRRQTSRAACLGKAIGLLQTITRLHDEFDTSMVAWQFVEPFTEWDEICTRGKPLQLTALGNPKKGTQTSSTDPYSLSQFLSLQHPGPLGPQIRFDKAKQMGGTTAALNVVIKERAVPEDGNGQGGGKDALGENTSIPTPEQLESHVNMLLTGLDPSDQMASDLYLKKLRTYYNKQGPEADKRLKALEEYITALYDFMKGYRVRLDKIDAQQNKAA